MTLNIAKRAKFKVNGLYEDGWFEGEIMHFNTELQEYLISFNDGTADYAATEDFNGVDLTVF